VARALAVALLAAALAVGGAGAATPKRGGTLVIGVPGQGSCLNPFGPCGITPGDLTQVLRGAFQVGPDLVPRPDLVSHLTIGRNPPSLTYHIRPAARWSDGVPVTAEDFRFTHRVFATTRTTSPNRPDARPLYGTIRRVQVLGPKTFRVELRKPALWDNRFLFFEVVLPLHALAGEDIAAVWRTRVDNPKTGRLIGSGPFLASLEPGRQLTLVRNPGYWRRHAHLDGIVLRVTPLEDRGLGPAARRNEVDIVPCCFHPADVRPLPGWRVVATPSIGKEHLAFRVGPGGHPALRSRAVRQALAYGIDRVELDRRLSAAFGARRRPLDSSVFVAEEAGYRANWRGYRYDPRRARRLLEQAGCTRGSDGIYSCEGRRLTLRLVTTVGGGNPPRVLTVELVRAQLQRAGVEIQPVYAPNAAFFNTLLERGDYHIALFTWNFWSGRAMPDVICGHTSNFTGYCNRLVMRDLARADSVVDPKQRARALNAADARLVRDVPLLPLYQQPLVVGVRTVVRGLRPGASFELSFQRSEGWWLDR
jgi:peptide/nickel transport system substrate-binding protein